MTSMHQCSTTKIKCFVCGRNICEECMTVSKDSLRCQFCEKAFKKQSPMPKPLSPKMTLALATTFISFMMIKFLNIISVCMT